jgi:hypothetical protein
MVRTYLQRDREGNPEGMWAIVRESDPGSDR